MHIHVCWSRWLLWTRPWGPWRGPPLVRLLALNRASGRFPFFLLQASLPPPPGVPLSRFPFPLPPATSQLREGCGLRPPACSCLSRKREPRSERLPCPGSMPASRELTEGKDKEASQGTPGPWVATSLHVQLPGAHPAPLHVSRAALHGGLLP